MVAFESSRPAVVAEAGRAWKPSRHLPLYLAGLAVGAGIGLGVTFTGGGEPGVVAAPVQPSAAEARVVGLPERAVAVEPASAGTLNAQVALAPELNPLSATAPAVVPEAAAPAAPAAPAAQPASNSQPVPAAQPATQPAPQPAAQPAAQPDAPTAKPNFYLPAVGAGPASALESGLLAGLNAERVNAGLPPLIYETGLSVIARTRSQQLVDQNYFGHVDPFGYSMYTELLAHYGYGYAWAGENLALNNFAVGESPQRAVAALMRSPSHRANILATDFSRVGIGEVSTADGRHYYTMIFLG